MKRSNKIMLLGLGLLIVAGVGLKYRRSQNAQHYSEILQQTPTPDAAVSLQPDYNDVTIPPNIAPLNVKILNPGRRYVLKVHAPQGQPIVVSNRHGSMRLPLRPWRTLLSANPGRDLYYDIAAQQPDGTWRRFPTVTNHIAAEPIDSHIAYRLLKLQYSFFRDIGVYQRNLETFKESLILHGRSYKDGCVNCHTFVQNDPNEMFLSIRSGEYGSSCLHVEGGHVTKIGTRFGHTTWHPNRQMAAYSFYDVRLFLHASRPIAQDVIEFDSLVAYYRLGHGAVQTSPALSDTDRLETHPCWDPNGRYLYFASAPKLWPDKKQFPPARFAEVRYDIQRVAYDPDTQTWGDAEIVVSAHEMGKSCVFPRISPDGRFLLFCVCNYSCFPLYQADSDLYVKNLKTGDIKRLDCNSEYCETWHTWSSNNRWIVYSTKRATGFFTRFYISFVDENGHSAKPFILPQKDPEFYDSYLYNYNIPELINGPVQIRTRQLIEAIRSPEKHAVDGVTQPSPQVPGPAGQDSIHPYRMRTE